MNIKQVLILCIISIFTVQLTAQEMGYEVEPPVLKAASPRASARAANGALPSVVDMRSQFPTPGFQGNIGSCVGWASAYAAKSFQENDERKWGLEDNDNLFSPSYIYNQINGGQDNGSSIYDALQIMVSKGAATLDAMAYTENYRQQPSRQAHQNASQFKAKTFEYVDPTSIDAAKSILAQGNCVIFGMEVYDNFYNYNGGVYREAGGSYLGGHAMTLVGYDDSKSAFIVINSWGQHWGDDGYLWLSYNAYTELCKTAWVMFDEVVNEPEESFPPQGVSASQGNYENEIRISWKNVKNALYYNVYRAEGAPNGFTKVGTVEGEVFRDTKAVQGVEYYYTVSSVSEGGESEASEVRKGWLKQPKVIGIPQGLNGLWKEPEVRLRWHDVEGVDGYRIYRWDNSVENFVLIGESKDSGFVDSKIPEDAAFTLYIISAFDGEREGEACSAVSVTIEREPVMPPPTRIAASTGTYSDKIVVAWLEVEDAISYRLYKRVEGEWRILAEVSRNYYTDKVKGEGYYAVSAVNREGESTISDYARGYTKGRGEEIVIPDTDDDTYRDDTYISFEDDSFFNGDSFFEGSGKTFMGSFGNEEADYFFGDSDAFFGDSSDFIKFEGADFFGDSSDFIQFDGDSFFD